MRPLTNDERALVERNLGLVAFLAKKYASARVSYEDRFQAGVVGLMQAAAGFDPALGPWGAYAAKGVLHHVWRAIDQARRAPEPFDTVELDPTEVRDDPAGPVLDDERDGRIRAALAELPEQWRTIVVEHYWNDRDHYEQARRRGCSRANVWQLEAKARKHIRARLEAAAV